MSAAPLRSHAPVHVSGADRAVPAKVMCSSLQIGQRRTSLLPTLLWGMLGKLCGCMGIRGPLMLRCRKH